MSPNDPTELLWELSDEYDRLEEEYLSIIKQHPIDFQRLLQVDRKRIDAWPNLMSKVMTMRQTHPTKVDDYMRLRHYMIWENDRYYEQ